MCNVLITTHTKCTLASFNSPNEHRSQTVRNRCENIFKKKLGRLIFLRIADECICIKINEIFKCMKI
jgi:hypothetical protein